MSFFVRKNTNYQDILSEYKKTEPFFFIYCGEILLNHEFETRWPSGRDDWYAIYLLSGTLDVTIGNETVKMNRGDMFVVSPDTPLCYNNKNSDEYIKYRLVHLLGTEVEKNLKECNIPKNKVFRVGVHEEIIGLWEELFKISLGHTEKLDFYFGIAIQYLFMKIAYFAENKKTRVKKLDKSIKYIHSNISEDIRVDELAKMEFLSPGRYREVFKKITGDSPTNYISALRIRLACELFSEGNNSIEHVAKTVGISDRTYFQKFFKKHTGKTPGAYIKDIDRL